MSKIRRRKAVPCPFVEGRSFNVETNFTKFSQLTATKSVAELDYRVSFTEGLEMVFGKVAVVISFLLLSAHANASLLAEPYAGYGTGKTETHLKPNTNFPNGLTVNSDDTEVSVGVRLGYKFSPGFWIAADPQFGLSGMAKYSDGSSDAFKRTQVFGDLGFDFSIIRTYIGYGFLNEADFGDSKNSGGQALKVGLEFQILSSVALMAEYHLNTFKESSSSTGTVQIADNYDKFNQSEFVVGLSIPFGGISDKR